MRTVTINLYWLLKLVVFVFVSGVLSALIGHVTGVSKRISDLPWLVRMLPGTVEFFAGTVFGLFFLAK